MTHNTSSSYGALKLLNEFHKKVRVEIIEPKNDSNDEDLNRFENVKSIYLEFFPLLDNDLRISSKFYEFEVKKDSSYDNQREIMHTFPKMILNSIEAQITRIKYLPDLAKPFQGVH